MKVICIYHSRDLDGWMSAAIVKKYYRDININNTNTNTQYNFQTNGEYTTIPILNSHNVVNFLDWDYGDDIPDLSEYDKVIMCDISFPKGEMRKIFKQRINNFVWLDHHISNIKEVGSIIPMEFTEEISVKHAACELTLEYFFPNDKMPEIVRLLGMYDSFRHKGTNEEQTVLEFQYGARAVISNYEEAYKWLNQNADTTISYIHNSGMHMYKYLCIEAKQTYAKAFPIKLKSYIGKIDTNGSIATVHTYKFLCVNQERFNPINFGIDYHKDGYDGFACFWYKDGKWTFSLYNDNGKVNCSEIAKQYSGGGHKGAAGFVIDDIDIIIK